MNNYVQRLKRFAGLAKTPREVQSQALLRILGTNRTSGYGQHYAFDRIESIDDFRRTVPLATFEDLRPWVEKDPIHGLTGERPIAFMRTSGSTGKPKIIPFTTS